MIEYRRIRIADVPDMTNLALDAIPEQPELAVSFAKVRALVAFFATSHEHFQLAAFKDGKPVAGIAAFVTEMPFHERNEATVIFCFSKEPGAGGHLLRALLRFVRNAMNIRRLSWAMNPGFDERIVKLARRLGFQSAHPTLMYYKGA